MGVRRRAANPVQKQLQSLGAGILAVTSWRRELFFVYIYILCMNCMFSSFFLFFFLGGVMSERLSMRVCFV